MTMYFDTYVFWTNNTGNAVSLGLNGNSWVSLCDKRKKENFIPLNGEEVLKKISNIKFTSWNYKHCDAKNDRHYGIMAQDFHAAFGLGADDRHITTIDEGGVALAAIQALAAQNAELASELAEVRAALATLLTAHGAK